MNKLEDIINSTGSEKLIGRSLFVNDVCVGLLLPSLVWSESSDGSLSFAGPKKLAKNVQPNSHAVLQALISIDAILFGEISELSLVEFFLNEPTASRTASYIFASSDNCKDFLEKMGGISRGAVLIVGCGGIGSLVAMNLAGAGVKRIHLVDADFIELSNLNRQFFWTASDLGLNKVDVLKKQINSRFSQINCTAEVTSFTSKDIEIISKEYSDVIITADEPLGLGSDIKGDCAHKIIASGYFHGYLRMEVGFNPVSVKSESWNRGPGFIGPSFGPSNTELAGVLSSFVIQRLCGLISRHDPSFSMEWSSREFPRRCY